MGLEYSMQTSSQILKDRFLKSAGPNSLVSFASMAILYVSQVLLARLLGVEQYGIYLYVLSWMAVIVLLGKFGMDVTLQRYLPEYLSKQQWSLCRGLLKKTFQIGAFSGTACTLIGLLIVISIHTHLEPILYQTFLIGMLILPFWILNKLTQGTLLALKRPALSQLPDGLILPTLLVVAVGIAYFVTEQTISARTAMLIHTIFWFITLSISILLLFRFGLPSQIKHASTQSKSKEWLYYSFPLLLISGTQLVMNYADIIMVGLLLDTTHAGIYAAAARVSSLVTTSLLLVNMILTPYISELFHNHRIDDLQHLVTFGTRIAGVVAVPVFIILYIFGDSILWLFGKAFIDGHLALIILGLGAMFNVFSGSVGYLMSMTGHQKQAAYFFSIGCVLNILLNLILIPLYGIEGAAIATACSVIFWNLSLAFYLKKQIKINATILAR